MSNVEGMNSIDLKKNRASTLCLWGDEDRDQSHPSAFRILN